MRIWACGLFAFACSGISGSSDEFTVQPGPGDGGLENPPDAGSAPALPSPAQLAPEGKIAGCPLSYVWEQVAGATDYQLLINGPSGAVAFQAWHPAASVCRDDGICFETPDLSFGPERHEWRVQAKDARGPGAWSEPRAFTPLAAMSCPPLPDPPEPDTWDWEGYRRRLVELGVAV